MRSGPQDELSQSETSVESKKTALFHSHDILDIWNLLSEPLAKWEKYTMRCHFRLIFGFHLVFQPPLPHYSGRLMSITSAGRRRAKASQMMMMMMAAMLYVYENNANIHHLKPSFKHPKYTIINYLARSLGRLAGCFWYFSFLKCRPLPQRWSWKGKRGKLSSEKSKRPTKSRIYSFLSRTTAMSVWELLSGLKSSQVAPTLTLKRFSYFIIAHLDCTVCARKWVEIDQPKSLSHERHIPKFINNVNIFQARVGGAKEADN